MKKLIPLLATIVFITACSDSAIYRNKVEFISEEWVIGDTVVYSAAIEDTSRSYDINLSLVHDPDFAFQNLYVKVLTGFPNDSIAQQVLSLQLSDGKGGWAGDCSSKNCNLTIPLSDSVKILQPGIYEFQFIQYSRSDTLPGVMAMEFSIEDHND